MSRSDIAWISGVAVVAMTIAPALKAIGLLPHDLLVSWGLPFPGLEQVFFGPLMAALLLLCFLKTRQALVFPVIGILRAFALGFVFPANLEHLGTGIAGILAGFMAAALLRNTVSARPGLWLALLAALYAGLYAAGNYLTACSFGPAAQTRMICCRRNLPPRSLSGHSSWVASLAFWLWPGCSSPAPCRASGRPFAQQPDQCADEHGKS